MSVKDNYPNLRPSLALNFAQTKTLDPRITFSRASTGTYYDGVTHAKAEENLRLYSQDFSQWTKQGVTATGSQTAPDGSSTAYLLTENSLTETHRVFIAGTTFVSGNTYTVSAFLKYVGRQYVQLNMSAAFSSRPVFDIQNGTVTDAAGATCSIIDVGGGWYRCIATKAATSSGVDQLPIGGNGTSTGNGETYTGSGSDAFYVWGAQVEQRSSVTAYTATTTQPITNYIPVLQSAAAGEARFDHDPVTGESKGLLIEEQRTNLVTYSEEFDNAAWSKTRASITANTIVAPDGTLTGDKLIPDATNDSHNISRQNIFSPDGSNRSWTVYAKQGEYRYIALTHLVSTYADVEVIFDLQTGTWAKPTGTNIAGSFDAVDVGNGWYRIGFYANTNNVSYDNFVIGISTDGTEAGCTFTGDGYSGIYVWGAQVEAGAFPTSYIKTTSAQATRSADSASMTGTNFSEWYRQDEGSVIVDFEKAPNSIAVPLIISGDGDNYIYGSAPSLTTARMIIRANGTTYSGLAATVPDTIKYAGAYKTNDAALSLNGDSALSDTDCILPLNMTELSIGETVFAVSRAMTIKRLTYYPARLTNAQLQALTEG